MKSRYKPEGDPVQACRSPCGERGLKSVFLMGSLEKVSSLPVRGAWVEILQALLSFGQCQVAPRAGSVG